MQGCDNSTPGGEAEFALEHGRGPDTLIFLEMRENCGENSAGSLYNLVGWNERFNDVPIAYIDYGDYESAWKMIMGKFLK